MVRAATVLGISILAASGGLFAQSTASSTLQGTIFDSSHAVVPKAEIAVASPSTGLKRTDTSGESGTYVFNQLPAGIYTVMVKAPGFTTAVYPKVELQVGTAAELNVSLTTGAHGDMVTVDASAPIIDTAKTDVSMAITPADVQNLPLNGRDFANLAFLAPGAKPVNAYDPTKARTAVFAVSGSGGRNVNVTVNGIDDKDNTVGGPVMQLPLEAVEEFNISTQRFSAANGRSEGAAINLVTKSGTNLFHGSLFLFDRDTVLNANDYFSKQGGQPTSPYSRQQYGGSFGGPIVKDKTFAYFAIERQREQSNVTVNQSAYTNLVLAEPLGAQPAHQLPTPYNDQRYTGRLDHRFSPSESLSVSYNSQGNRGLNDQAGSTNDLTAGNFTTNRLILATASLTSVLSPSVVNSFTAGYQYWNNVIDSNTKVPYVLFPSAAFGTNPNVPQQSYQKKWQFRDDYAWTKGKHSFKTGFDFVKLPQLGGFFQTPSTLNVSFFDDPTKITTDKADYPNGFATPGAVSSMTASAGNSYFSSAHAKMFGLYFQDDWKVTPRLTIDLGVRWDKDYDLTGGDTQNLNRTYLALKAIGSPYAGNPKNDNKDFSPRVGFAYDITGSGHHVIRGGYGIYFDQTFQNIPLFAEQQEGATIFTQVLNLSSSGPGDSKASLVPGTNILLSNYRYGVDPLPLLPAPSANLTAGATGWIVSPNYHNPYNQEWNLAYSWQLSANDAVSFEGIHTLGLREEKRVNINPKDLTTGARVYDAAFTAAGLPKLAQIYMPSSVNRSRYDAFNVVYTHRFTRHFSINTNYVRSRALAYGGAAASYSNAAINPNAIFGPGELGPSPSDEPNRWVFSGYYEAPLGFRIAPIVQWASGRPYNATEGISDIYGYGSGNAAWRAVVPVNAPTDYTATATYTASQLVAGLANGTLKTLPFDYFRGNAFFQMDLRVSKEFKFGERHKLEFIAQLFDLTNRANFGTQYTTSIRSSNFGKPSNFLSASGTVVPHAFEGELGFMYRF